MPFRSSGQDTGTADPTMWKQAAKYIDEMHEGIKKLVSPVADVAEYLNKIKANAGGAAASLGQMAALGYAKVMLLVDGLKAFARAGLEGTGQAAMLSFETQQFARGVAAVFLPVINLAVDALRRLSDFFHHLSESQQNALQGLVVGIGVIKAVGSALALLGVEAGIATGGLSLIAGAIAAVATGASGGGALGKLGDVFTGLLDAVKPVLDVFSDLFDSVFAAIEPAIAPALAMIQKLAGVFGEAFGSIINDLKPFLVMMADSFVGNLKIVGDIIDDLLPIFGELMESFSDLAAAVAPLIKDMGDAFNELMTDVLAPMLKWILHEFVDGIKTMIDWIVKAIAFLKAAYKQIKEGGGLLDIDELKAKVQIEYDAIKGESKRNQEGGATKAAKPGRQIEPGPGSFEAIDQMFKRIQAAASDTGKAAQENTADNTERTANLLDDIKKWLAERLNLPGKPPLPMGNG